MVLTITRLAAFLLLSFWFCTKKGKDRLSYVTEGSPSHLLQRCYRCRISSEHKVDPIGFPPALIKSAVAGIQSLIQPMELLKVAHCNLTLGLETKPPLSYRYGEHLGPPFWAYNPPKPSRLVSYCWVPLDLSPLRILSGVCS